MQHCDSSCPKIITTKRRITKAKMSLKIFVLFLLPFSFLGPLSTQACIHALIGKGIGDALVASLYGPLLALKERRDGITWGLSAAGSFAGATTATPS